MRILRIFAALVLNSVALLASSPQTSTSPEIRRAEAAAVEARDKKSALEFESRREIGRKPSVREKAEADREAARAMLFLDFVKGVEKFSKLTADSSTLRKNAGNIDKSLSPILRYLMDGWKASPVPTPTTSDRTTLIEKVKPVLIAFAAKPVVLDLQSRTSLLTDLQSIQSLCRAIR